MTSAAGVTSQLQVLPESVHFDDVSTDQPIYTTVTVKVTCTSIFYSRPANQPDTKALQS